MRGFLPLQYYMIIHENMIVCTVCDYTFAVEMHMVEHSWRNWLSDAPEGGGDKFCPENGEGYYMIIYVKI